MKTTRADWLVPTALVALSLVPSLAGIVRLVELAHGATITPANARFFAAPWPIVAHVPAVIVFSMLGAFQFSASFRRNHRTWHRVAGRLLILSGILVALSGLCMLRLYAWPAGDGVVLYGERIVVGLAMLACIARSVWCIALRDFTSHGHWMMRAYALAMGAGTQVLTHLPWFVLADGKPGEAPRAVMMGAGWAINVVVAEWIIRRPHANATAVRSAAASSALQSPRSRVAQS
jgi:hypothetical protein